MRWGASLVLVSFALAGCEPIAEPLTPNEAAARDYWLESRLAKGDGGIRPVDKTLEEHPADFEDARTACLAAVTLARAEVTEAMEVAQSLRDYDRMRCLEVRARDLATLEPVIANGGNGLAETDEEEPVIAAHACRLARRVRKAVDTCEGG